MTGLCHNFLDKELSPTGNVLIGITNIQTGKFPFFVKNFAHLLEAIKDIPIYTNWMVSLDIVSLVIKVPTDETISNF